MMPKVFIGSFYTMSKLEDTVSFTVRIPRDLATQITRRASVSRRSRNQEIISLIISALDSSVSADLAAIPK